MLLPILILAFIYAAINPIECSNKYLFTIPYSPITNAVEMYFNQIKTHIKKNRNVYTFEELGKNIDKAIYKVKPENYKNYFEYA